MPFVGHIVLVEDRLDGALWNAGPAVDAFFGIDEDHRLPFVKTLCRAYNDAICVLAAKTRFRNNHRHGNVPFVKTFENRPHPVNAELV